MKPSAHRAIDTVIDQESAEMRPSTPVPPARAGVRRALVRRLLRVGAVCALLLAFASTAVEGERSARAKALVAGVDYTVLARPFATASGSRIELLEVFNYACGHCAGDKNSIFTAYAPLGVDPARFRAEYDSRRVDERLGHAKALMRAADVGGVPALIVAGRYRIDADEHITFDAMLATADYLIRLERARLERGRRAATP